LQTIPCVKDPTVAPVFQRLFFIPGSLFFILLLAGCAADSPSILDPRGPAATSIAELWWLIFGLGTVIFLLVMVALGLALFRRRSSTASETGGSTRNDNRVILWAGIIGPAIVLIVIFALSVRTMAMLSSTTPGAEFVVHVTGHQWWWEVQYPNQAVETANEIHIPVGQPILVRLSTEDVIHNFWIPNLHGKMDMVPGQTNEFWIQADTAGEYWGECAEFCGIQHAKMRFVVVAEPLAEFTAWLDQQRAVPPAPVDALAQRGQQIFLGSACVYCHAVEGTNATGDLGPNLTHLASRRTLAAGVLLNTRGNLAGWLTGPQHIKPGNLMPPTELTGDELQALLAYLDTLE